MQSHPQIPFTYLALPLFRASKQAFHNNAMTQIWDLLWSLSCFSGLFFRQITFLQWLEWSNINNFTNTAEETLWEAGKSSCGQQAFELILPINTCPEAHKHPDKAKRHPTLVPRADKWENSDPLSSSDLPASTLQTEPEKRQQIILWWKQDAKAVWNFRQQSTEEAWYVPPLLFNSFPPIFSSCPFQFSPNTKFCHSLHKAHKDFRSPPSSHSLRWRHHYNWHPAWETCRTDWIGTKRKTNIKPCIYSPFI